MSQDSKNRRVSPPWGTVAGLMGACVVTLVGVARGMDPDVILLRAASAAVLMGVVVSIGSCVLNLLRSS